MTLFSSILRFFVGKRGLGPVDKVFFGIGNPGPKFSNTRHNVGFEAIDRFARSLSTHSKFCLARDSDVIVGNVDDFSCALVKPQTYVNQCGEALKAIIEKTHCPLDSCLIIVDDYHLPLGTIRLRRAGSHGGHNGLKSIIGLVGSEFPRLRIGIGPMPSSTNPIDFVLGRFQENESVLLKQSLERSYEAMKTFAVSGIDKAMNIYNT